ncbi:MULTISPECIES: hypothetical protein [Thermoanaerobacterium]|uniref:hypothetical protein n=1 Tax=Thermoanaerobacterium TaxID=28895 RepID=UPI000BB8738A|nr:MULTISPECIES: hypothetical protein [Thermoanaerobacterium]KAA5806798.1 hypothetical protein F1655_08150 [Thermoanaerobacterium thermosaccharolyticum]MDK2806367.1 hypothetical protein [Thermoanaerobacterium sp.]MDK2830186.1 hypothetical protein [Clostridium butyricum]SNX52746.1 hypothetical protein SAMN05660242_0183 [Thermoanaerobacterium sp. RBIITD]
MKPIKLLSILFICFICIIVLTACNKIDNGNIKQIKTDKDASINMTVEDENATKVIYEFYKLVVEKKPNEYVNLYTEQMRNLLKEQNVKDDTKYIKSADIKEIEFLKDMPQEKGTQEYKVKIDLQYENVPEDLKSVAISGERILFITLKFEDGGWKIASIGTGP